MADNRKYYYLKLKEDFFESDEAVVLESMPDGYIYSNILLKLYLRSLKNDGILMFNNLIPYNSHMLATITRHQVGTVEKAVNIFKDLQLIEILDNGAIYMTNIKNFVGKSSKDADRKRAEYNKIKRLGEISTIGTEKSPPEIEIEIEKVIEKDIDINIELDVDDKKTTTGTSIQNYYQQRIGPLDGFQFQQLTEYVTLDGMDVDVVIRAITEAADNGKRNFKYILAILRNWKQNGIKTIVQVEERERQRIEQKVNYSNSGNNTQPQRTNVPTWSTEPVKTEQTTEGQAKLAELFAELEAMEGADD
ncbi:phage replisome organizer N-terminal domain-containing protein [Collinsella sp. LCP19S3_G10]|uniref:phage replisome organizer N-terminal domain-containing protein n=1 Tax=Collinsella sp. LCP19S3_G10 TaxID=3438766 RepID=UPI003F92E2C2